MQIIDASLFKKEDLIIKSLTGEEWTIPGNLSTAFYMNMADAAKKIDKAKADPAKGIEMLKSLCLDIIKLDKTKSPTMQTIDEQFDDFGALQAIVTGVMQYTANITNDPNSKSPLFK